MNLKKKRAPWWAPIVLIVLAALAGGAVLAACTSTSADTVNRNLSTEADEFNVVRKIVAVNTRTDTVLFEVTGRCSMTRDGDLVLTCREGPDQYKRHYIGSATDVAWTAIQLESVDVDRYQTKILFRPTSVIPDVDLSVGER